MVNRAMRHCFSCKSSRIINYLQWELEAFLYFDVDSFSKRRILDALKEARDTNAESVEIIFNVFFLIIHATQNVVELVNDVDGSDPGLTMPMDQFQTIVEE